MTTNSRRHGDDARPGVQRLERLYAEHGRAVLAYAVRRVADEQDAADVVAETFLVAWRRLDQVQEGEQALMWLYEVARRLVANQRRGDRRRQRLAAQLGRELAPALQAVQPPPAVPPPILAALASLEPADREVVLLAAWEELSPAQIAAVLGISTIATRSRLHRARKRLRAALDPLAQVDDAAQLNAQEAL